MIRLLVRPSASSFTSPPAWFASGCFVLSWLSGVCPIAAPFLLGQEGKGEMCAQPRNLPAALRVQQCYICCIYRLFRASSSAYPVFSSEMLGKGMCPRLSELRCRDGREICLSLICPRIALGKQLRRAKQPSLGCATRARNVSFPSSALRPLMVRRSERE